MKSATDHSQILTDHLPTTSSSLPTTYRPPSPTTYRQINLFTITSVVSIPEFLTRWGGRLPVRASLEADQLHGSGPAGLQQTIHVQLWRIHEILWCGCCRFPRGERLCVILGPCLYVSQLSNIFGIWLRDAARGSGRWKCLFVVELFYPWVGLIRCIWITLMSPPSGIRLELLLFGQIPTPPPPPLPYALPRGLHW